MGYLAVKPDPFYSRKNETASLERSWGHPNKGGQMYLLMGRRRLGKTYLLQHYFSSGLNGTDAPRPHCYYLADQTSDVVQRVALAEQLLTALPDPGVSINELSVSWNAILRHLSTHATGDVRFSLIIDEFSYLIEQDTNLPSIIQSWWDREGLHSKVMLVLCGSQLSVMTAIGSDTSPLYGRFNGGILELKPLRYDEITGFYEGSHLYNLRDMLVMYGALGGTPRYHSMVNTANSADEEIVNLLMRPGGALEYEIRYLLGSEQIREPAPYNAILGAIASGHTQYARIQQLTGVERGSLSFNLRVLTDLGWIEREYPFMETNDRRAIYRLADPFLAFWYRFVTKCASDLQFSDPMEVYKQKVAPYIPDYMGRYAFEPICRQWLLRNAENRLGLTIKNMGRYWNRDCSVEVDIAAELEGDRYLFGECKWSESRPIGVSTYTELCVKVGKLPFEHWQRKPYLVLFTLGGYSPDLQQIASDPENRLTLFGPDDLLPRQQP